MMHHIKLNRWTIPIGKIKPGDCRDPGYILSYHSFMNRADGTLTSQDLIIHAIFNIRSQAAHFMEQI